ncbi:testis-specific serine/threonine-protein kinase 4-like [Oppia nitens]|uniref:testis-specific serine/threonine-protein kinase 4-like n=1 Tax=Oppia nitens TaxID=1686743 RepID=UPI0023DB4A17|nr:testis-specific serine/threonine-protein kinase 4-like [Oppia nitens]
MGNTICYYICCSCCCSRYNRREDYLKKERHKEKKRTMRQFSKLSKSHKTRVEVGSYPTNLTIEEISNIVEIPNAKYNTEDDVIAGRGYLLGQKLGEGKFATVYEATDIKFGTELAVKVMVLSDKKYRKAERNALVKDITHELFMLERIRHLYVVRLGTHFVVENHTAPKSTVYIVMQRGVGGTLAERNKQSGPFNEDVCRIWFSQMLSALVYMHASGIVHRDLKTQNILLDITDDILISDFGLSRVVYREGVQLESNTFCGTPSYMAPELVNMKLTKQERRRRQTLKKDSKDGQPKLGYMAPPVDVWALGVVLFTLFTQKFPYDSSDLNRWSQMLVTDMQHKKYHFERHLQPSTDLVNIMDQMFEPDPTRRSTMLLLTRHPWIVKKYEETNNKVIDWFKSKKLSKNI